MKNFVDNVSIYAKNLSKFNRKFIFYMKCNKFFSQKIERDLSLKIYKKLMKIRIHTNFKYTVKYNIISYIIDKEKT